MSANGLPVFDKTVQTTHIWLDEIQERIGPDRQRAWRVLNVVLHCLRDRLTIDEAAHLGAQLPLLVRGAYYDRFHPSGQPTRSRSRAEFVAEVASGLRDGKPVDPEAAIGAVLDTLSRNIDLGQVEKTRHVLPEALREMWSRAEEPV